MVRVNNSCEYPYYEHKDGTGFIISQIESNNTDTNDPNGDIYNSSYQWAIQDLKGQIYYYNDSLDQSDQIPPTEGWKNAEEWCNPPPILEIRV